VDGQLALAGAEHGAKAAVEAEAVGGGVELGEGGAESLGGLGLGYDHEVIIEVGGER